ncbi:MAG: permease, partial [Candidatus Solibacter sp.]|nr:permease [Candidatus Solibacter sp.]
GSYPDYLDIRDRAATLAGVAAHRSGAVRLSGEPAQLISAAIVTGNYFTVLGVRPAAGRLLTPDDDHVSDAHPVAVISELFWQKQFAGDPAVVGRSVALNGYPFTVIGVAESFSGIEFGQSNAVWVPMAMVRHFMTRQPDYNWLTNRRAGWLTFFARLKPGVTATAAQAEINGIARDLESRYSDTNQGREFRVEPRADLTAEQAASLRSLLGMLLLAVSVVLLITCGNVAVLLLARATARVPEMALRLALGAGRSALVRMLLLESTILALASAALGVLLAPWMVAALRRACRWEDLTRSDFSVVNWNVLAFTAGVSVLCVVLFGLPPAWFAMRTDPAAGIRNGSAQAGGARSLLQSAWVVAQITLSVALTAGGGSVLHSMQRILAIDPGYRPQPVVVATLDLSVLGYSPERGTRFLLELTERLSRYPGVRAASTAKSSPAVDWSDRVAVFGEGDAKGRLTVDQNRVTPQYFRTLGIPLLAGRDFARTDTAGRAPVAILSKSLADHLWPGADPIGRRIVIPIDREPLPPPVQVIGVAADSRYRSILDAPPYIVYTSVLQGYDSIARVMVAVDGAPGQFRTTLRQAIGQMDPALPVAGITTLQEQIGAGLWRERAAATLMGFFSVLALGLACAGLYAIVAFTVARRTREIGIRMALGADRPAVVRGVVSFALRHALAGIAIGVPLAFLARPTLRPFLYRAPSLDGVLLLGVPLLFVAIAMAAAAFPARRAASTDPSITLRQI